MRTALVWLFVLSLLPSAIASPLNLRHPAPSPDGSQVCFSYRGDLWVVPAEGGRAERLTVHIGYDAHPSWSPDGRFIAFSTDRHGNYDIYLIPADGGEESRLTYHSADDILTCWSPDSRKVLFSSQRELGREEIYEIVINGGRPKPLLSIAARQGRLSPDRKRLLFSRGLVPWWRKGYRGTADCDLFVKDLGSGGIEQLTAHNGNDLEGFWTADGSAIIYLSDSTGSYNIFRKDLTSGATEKLTNHRLNAAFPSLSFDGSLLAYELGGEIFLYDFTQRRGSKLLLEAPSGAKSNTVEHEVFNSGAEEMAVSPDGNSIAFTLRGDVFCLDSETGVVRRLTNTISTERQLSWSHDSRKLAYSSNRDGTYDIFLTSSTDPKRPSLALSHQRSQSKIVGGGNSEGMPLISPANGEIAFVRSETELIITDKGGKTERKLTEGNIVREPQWSPDGRYLVFTQLDKHWNNDIYISDSESGNVVNITRNPGHYQSPRFSPDGRLVCYIRDGDLYYLYLRENLAQMTSWQRALYLRENGNNNSGIQPVQIDFEGIADRSKRLTGLGLVEYAAITPDSREVVFATLESHLWCINLDGTNLRLIASGIDSPKRLQFAADISRLFFADIEGRFFSININDGTLSEYRYSFPIRTNRKELYKQVFSEAVRLLRDRFYDPSYHEIDWGDIESKYEFRIEKVAEQTDFYDIIREMLGEFNASHLAIWPNIDVGELTGCTGITPDFQDNSSGLKIESIIPNSPAASTLTSLKPSDKIMAVDGVRIGKGENYYRQFEGSAGREVGLEFISREGITHMTTITPILPSEYQELWQSHQTALRSDHVDKLSGGKIAYIHIRQMDQAGLELFRRDLARISTKKKGLLLDIRDNLGGFVHDQMLDLLSGDNYVTHRPRFGDAGSESRIAFEGPIVLLVNEHTSSDAEIFAHGFRKLGLGKIIGVTTYGAVIGSENYTLIDGSTIVVPSVGWYSPSGENLEQLGIAPDVNAYLDLTRLDQGEDGQLERAVTLLLESF